MPFFVYLLFIFHPVANTTWGLLFRPWYFPTSNPLGILHDALVLGTGGETFFVYPFRRSLGTVYDGTCVRAQWKQVHERCCGTCLPALPCHTVQLHKELTKSVRNVSHSALPIQSSPRRSRPDLKNLVCIFHDDAFFSTLYEQDTVFRTFHTITRLLGAHSRSAMLTQQCSEST